MKKLVITIVLFAAIFMTVNAQTTVVVNRPGILTDLAGAASALVQLPVSLAEGIVVGTAEAAGSLINGSTSVYVVPQTPVVTTPVVTTVPGYPTPIVTTPAPVVTRPVVVAPPVPATTTITTYSPGGVVSVTRPVSTYETGNIVIPAPVEYRVGTSPYVNPYIRRYR